MVPSGNDLASHGKRSRSTSGTVSPDPIESRQTTSSAGPSRSRDAYLEPSNQYRDRREAAGPSDAEGDTRRAYGDHYRARSHAYDEGSRSAADDEEVDEGRRVEERRYHVGDQRDRRGGPVDSGSRSMHLAESSHYEGERARGAYVPDDRFAGYDQSRGAYYQDAARATGSQPDAFASDYRYGRDGDAGRYEGPGYYTGGTGSGPSDLSGIPATLGDNGHASTSSALRGGSHEARAAPEGFSKVSDGRRYRLVVVQHPNRARMCGFGDKDRRPLSPTLIVKLIITDEATGEEISPLEVNTSLFLLATDLCHPDDLMLSPRNILVHHNAQSLPFQGPGYGSSALPYGSTAPHLHPGHGASMDSEPPYSGGGRSSGQSDPSEVSNGGQLNRFGAIDPANRSRSTSDTPRDSPPVPPRQHAGSPSSHGAPPPAMFPTGFGPAPAESYTRILVGAAVASASVLKDESEKWCTFFVFQDISVRTEGVYRIKLMFVNLEVNGRVGTGVSEALAETYTDPFTVYSPRKFPGMLDPTPLSRKLASQGIKIPVRNDKKKQRRRADDGGDGGGAGYDDDQGDDDNDDD